MYHDKHIKFTYPVFFYFLDDFEMYVWGKNQKGCLGIYVAQQLDQSYPFRVIATTVVFVKKRRGEITACVNCHLPFDLGVLGHF